MLEREYSMVYTQATTLSIAMIKSKYIYLVSGLSITRRISFTHQLELLGRVFVLYGYKVVLLGNADNAQRSEESERLRVMDVAGYNHDTLSPLLDRFPPYAVILLGYPDQFAYFAEDHIAFPVFLWSQFSRAPKSLPERFEIIPLTYLSAIHVVNSGGRLPATVIPHGVDTEIFRPISLKEKWSNRTAMGLPEESSILLSVGANSYRKRFDLLLKAFSFVCRKNTRSYLLIKTDIAGKSGGFDLGKLCKAIGISDRVMILSGEFTDDKLSRLYAMSDVYVHTAEWEGFGIPIIEAMACSLPVVTHPVQGPAEILPYTEIMAWDSEVLMDSNTALRQVNPHNLSEKIIQCITNPGLARRTGEMGRRAAVENFDIRSIAKIWENTMLSHSVAELERGYKRDPKRLKRENLR